MIRVLECALAAAVYLPLSGCGLQTATTAATTSASSTAAPVTRSSSAPVPAQPKAVKSGELALITEPRQGVVPALEAIRGARRRVDLVMYELEDPQVEAALAADEARGVPVRVLLSCGYYGETSKANQPAFGYLAAHHVPVRWTSEHFAFTHQKTLVVDGTADILTFNLTAQYYATSRDFGVIDTDRPDVAAIEQTFGEDWRGDHDTAPPTGDDLLWSPGAEHATESLINSAKHSLDIYNEEMAFKPVIADIEAAARRGVHVRIVMTSSSEWHSAFAAEQAAGAQVHTFPDATGALYIHAKMIGVDGREWFLGSQNFSTTSLERNRELGIVFTTRTLGHSLERTFSTDFSNSTAFSG